jgi:membrane fusion protein (multidrug efflux system)
MKRQWALLLAGAFLAATLAGCAQKSDAQKGESTAGKPPVAVETTTVQPSPIIEGIEVTGSLEPKFSADVKTQILGLVRQVYVTEWVRVRKGQPLARIDVAESEALVKRAEASVESARASMAQAEVALNRAEREKARALKLKEAGLATQQALDDARTEAEAAQARVEAARAQIRVEQEMVRQARARLGKGFIVAPIDGVVSLRDVNVGDLASDAAAARPIFRIVDNRLLNLTVTVSSADSARVKVGQPLEFTVDALPGKLFRGRVMFINPELSPTDRSLKVIAEVKNVPEELKGGLFVKGRIVTGGRDGALQLPRSALAAWDTASRTANIFVVEGETARLRKVATGIIAGDLVEIVTGLKGGERFVTRGAFTLKEGDKVAIARP